MVPKCFHTTVIVYFDAFTFTSFIYNFLSSNFTMKEKEKLYVELKQLLARQTGPEAAEQLQQCQWIIRDRTKKLKVFSCFTELTLCSPHVASHICVIIIMTSIKR